MSVFHHVHVGVAIHGDVHAFLKLLRGCLFGHDVDVALGCRARVGCLVGPNPSMFALAELVDFAREDAVHVVLMCDRRLVCDDAVVLDVFAASLRVHCDQQFYQTNLSRLDLNGWLSQLVLQWV